MAAKRRRKKSNKGAVFTALCVIAFILILALGQTGFVDSLEEIWQGFSGPAGGVDAAALAQPEQYADRLILYVIDTGNSDSMLLVTPEGQSMLVDAADDDDFARISAVLDAFSVESLSVAVATHPDADHIGSMDDVVANYTPAQFYMPDLEKDTRTYVNMEQQLQSHGTPVIYAQAGQSFDLGSAHVTILNPQAREYDDFNECSVVLLIEYGQTTFLLTGDIEEGALADILAAYPGLLDVDVLKIAHHGSAASTSQEFLSATTPQVALITCGEDNSYGHPHRETTDLLDQNGITTLRTDRNEDIVVYSDGASIEYKTAA